MSFSHHSTFISDMVTAASTVFGYFLLLSLFIVCNAANHFFYEICNNTANGFFTNGSTMESNLQKLMEDLVDGISVDRFKFAAEGNKSRSAVYGIAQCTAYAKSSDCRSCVSEANSTFRDRCRNAMGGAIFGDDCFLRWETYNFSREIATMVVHNCSGSIDNNTAANLFNDTVVKTLDSLREKTISVKNGTIPYSILHIRNEGLPRGLQDIYAFSQGWNGASAQQCGECLSYALQNYTSFCSNGRYRYFYADRNCFMRYDTYDFSGEFKERARKQNVVVWSVILSVYLLLLSQPIMFLVRVLKKPKENPVAPISKIEPAEKSLPSRKINVRDIDKIEGDKQLQFPLESIKTATNNFHNDHQLGEGGYGIVYKGTLPSGIPIAVKKLLRRSFQGENDFLNEIEVLAKIQHRNLVSLLGCCVNETQKMLVCEYMVNGSLEGILLDPNKRRQLDWPKRRNIILGVAEGLLYLHRDSRVRIIHRDIKASNILLDHNFNAKIADFGLAKLFPEDKTSINTDVKGTLGYIAPECFNEGKISPMIDVYSFGILMLEIISGRENINLKLPSEMQSLLRWTWTLYKHQSVWDMVDEFLKPICPVVELQRFITVALLCTKFDPARRPKMSDVITMLSSTEEALPEPDNPPFFCGTSPRQAPASFADSILSESMKTDRS